MNCRQVALTAFLVSVALGLCHALSYCTLLPGEVAARFDAHGMPEGAMARSTMIDLHLTLVIGLAALFLIAVGAVSRSPRAWFSADARRWWLTDEREACTRRDLTARVLWLGVATQVLVLTEFHRAVRVNLGRAEALGAWWIDVAVFVGLALVWATLLWWRYRRPAVAAS